LIQWGYFPDQATQTITFDLSYNSIPYIYVTKYGGGGNNAAEIVTLSATQCTIDSSAGDGDKVSFLWLAIGLANV
jgi:hypothetical protein